MTIQSLSNRPREISVTEAIEPAYDRMKRMLFQPFDFSKWIIIGFCAWLASLGESGGGGGYSGFGGNHDGQGGQPGEQLRQFYHRASDYVMANLDLDRSGCRLCGAAAPGHLAAGALAQAGASSCSCTAWPGQGGGGCAVA